MLYAMCFLLFMIGLYCAVVKKNMVKIVIGVAIMEYAINLFLIMLGFRKGGIAYCKNGPESPGDILEGAILLTAGAEHYYLHVIPSYSSRIYRQAAFNTAYENGQL